MLKQFYSQFVKGAHVWIKDAPTRSGWTWIFHKHLNSKMAKSQACFPQTKFW